jgi:ligand-binding sensor domain-containing protein
MCYITNECDNIKRFVMKITLLIVFLMCLLCFKANSQQLDSNWAVVTTNEVFDMVDDGENIWIAGYGLKVINKNTEEVTYFNKFNSNFPTDYAYSIAIDSKGNKWIGTDNGIIKYDGISWLVFNHNNGFPIDSMTSLKVISLAIGSNDSLWIGTNRGYLICYDMKNWKVFNVKSSINDIYLFQNKEYLATDNGISIYDGDKWIEYNSEIKLSNCNAIVIDNKGVIWIGTMWGLVRFDGVDWFKYDYTNTNVHLDYVASLTLDSTNTLYICGYTGLLFTFDGIFFKKIRILNNFGGNYNTRILKDNFSNDIFYGSQAGIYKLSKSIVTNIKTNKSYIPQKKVQYISISDRNEVMIGTNIGAVIKSENDEFRFYEIDEPSIVAIEESNNEILLGTEFSGIIKYTSDISRQYHDWDNSINSDMVTAIKKDKKGIIWICAIGISNYDGTIMQQTLWNVFEKYGLSTYASIVTIAINRDNVKWFGSFDSSGIFSYDDNNLLNYKPADSSKFVGINTIAIDSSNNLWIGTIKNGVWNYKNGDWKYFNKSNSNLISDKITSIAIDKKQNVWIGTLDSGIIKYNGIEFFKYNSKNSKLRNDTINTISVDQYDNLWIGTNDCLYIFNENKVTLNNNEDFYKKQTFDYISISPNPTNDLTNICYNIEKPGIISLYLIDALGNSKLLKREYKFPGDYTEQYNLNDMPQGVYNIVIKTDNGFLSKKIVLLK